MINEEIFFGEGLWDDVVVATLLRGESVIIPGFGYLELKSFSDRRTVFYRAFPSGSSQVYLISESPEKTDINSDLYNRISFPLKNGNVVSVPKIGTFRPVIREDGSVRISYTVSTHLRYLLNERVPEVKEKIRRTTFLEESPEKTNNKQPNESELIKTETKYEEPILPSTKEVTKEVFSEKTIITQKNSKETPVKKKPFLMWVVIAVGIISILLFLSTFFNEGGVENKTVNINVNEEESTEYNSESISNSEATNLPNLARKHYGNANFWVYIYDANRSKLKSPVNVPEGVEIEIPDLIEYGVDVNDNMEVERAIERAKLILKQ
jgi:nucleoid DNA-binding protein